MGSSADPSLIGTLFAALCISPWLLLIVVALRDRPRRQRQAPYREIKPRENMMDERAGFVEAKMEKIERAMR